MFILYWDAAKQKVFAMNGSGRAPAKNTLDQIRGDLGLKDGDAADIPISSVHAATVPGAPAGWVDTIERFGSGKVDMAKVLEPAIKLGENGYPVSEITASSVGLIASPSHSMSCIGANKCSGPLLNRLFAKRLPTSPRFLKRTLLPKEAYEPLAPVN